MTVLYIDQGSGTRPATFDEILAAAKAVIARRFRRGDRLPQSHMIAEYLRLRLLPQEHEVFAAVFLDGSHHVIQYRELFHGTVDWSTVHVGEVVKAALLCNASVVLVAHNHLSGDVEPSDSDRKITKALQRALETVQVKLLDHFIVCPEGHSSFADRGLL